MNFVKFLFLSCIIQFNAQANFIDFKHNLNDLKFYRYAQPQLKNLSTEFFLVLKKLNANHESFIDIQKSLTTHLHHLTTCKNLKYCAAVDKITHDLNLYEKTLWKIQNNLTKINTVSEDFDIDKILRSSNLSKAMLKQVYLLKSDLDIYLAIDKNGEDAFLKHKFFGELKKLQLKAQLGATSLIDNNYQGDFNLVYENFIMPIQKHILQNNDKNFLISRFRELDAIWNTFHMKVDREVQNFPKESLSLIKIMHNRWNSVLKTILR